MFDNVRHFNSGDRADFVDYTVAYCMYSPLAEHIDNEQKHILARIPGAGVKTMFGQRFCLNEFGLEF